MVNKACAWRPYGERVAQAVQIPAWTYQLKAQKNVPRTLCLWKFSCATGQLQTQSAYHQFYDWHHILYSLCFLGRCFYATDTYSKEQERNYFVWPQDATVHLCLSSGVNYLTHAWNYCHDLVQVTIVLVLSILQPHQFVLQHLDPGHFQHHPRQASVRILDLTPFNDNQNSSCSTIACLNGLLQQPKVLQKYGVFRGSFLKRSLRS